MSWVDSLQQASFRGVPFAVLNGDSHFGRRIALHEYPYRDTPWVEDLGRGTRRISLTGFLVEDSLIYGGGSVLAQRDALVAAAETAGPGRLSHPTLGDLTVSLAQGGLAVTERSDHGRYFEVTFAFIEAGQRLFPSTGIDTGAQVGIAAAGADTSASSDFLSAVSSALQSGAEVVDMAVSAVAPWVAGALQAAADATLLFNLTTGLQGSYGRFAGGAALGVLVSTNPTVSSQATTGSLILQGAVARVAVSGAASGVTSAAQGLSGTSITAFTTAVQALPAALISAAPNPADQIRLLESLATYTPDAVTPASQVGIASGAMQTASGALLRRAAIVAMARASAAWQPFSYDDAAAMRTLVTGYLDSEITVAGDSGDDASYSALRILRKAVVVDLTTRGASLASMKTFDFSAALPALYVANRIYQDPTRANQLVAEADPPHPAFMPTAFRALAS